MLCTDIKTLKVLGTPDEHFLGVLNNNKEKTGQELVDSFKINGNLYNSDFYSIKLMYNYLNRFGYWISKRHKSLILISTKNYIFIMPLNSF